MDTTLKTKTHDIINIFVREAVTQREPEATARGYR